MYNLGEAGTKLDDLFNSVGATVIDVTNYVCNGTNIRIQYTRSEVHKILHVSFILEHDYAVCAFYIKDGSIDSYIPSEIFYAVRDTFLFNDTLSTNAFFDILCEHILETEICEEVPEDVFGDYVRHAGIRVNNNHDRLYFNHLRKAKLSSEMVKKIYRITSDSKEASEIVKYLRLIKKTLVFVDDFDRRKNLTLENIKCLHLEA